MLIDQSILSTSSRPEKLLTQTSLCVKDEIESKLNIMFTPRDSENLALTEQIFKDENETGFN
jgi:hypothetical protein